MRQVFCFLGFLIFLSSSLHSHADALNLLENAGFEHHDRGEVMFWAQADHSSTSQRLGAVSLTSPGPIVYSVQPDMAHQGDGAVLFRRPDLSMRHSLQYWRRISDRQLEIDQWKRSSVHVSAWFRPEQPGAKITFRIAVFGDLPLGLHTEQMALDSSGWQRVSFTIPPESFGGKDLKRLDLQVFYVEGTGQLWCDDIEVMDDLPTSDLPSSDGLHITADGYLRLADGTLFVPQAIWGAGLYASPASLSLLYALLAEHGFNTLYLMPSYYLNYATKRHLRVMLDTAYETGLKAIVQVPIYPLQSDGCGFHRGYIQEWVHAFRDHPALLGWYLLDADLHSCLIDLIIGDGQGATPTDWIHEAEDGLFHPVLLSTSDLVYSDPAAYSGIPGSTSFHQLGDMASVADILVPNIFPLREFGDAPRTQVSLVSDIATSAVDAMGVDSPKSMWTMVQTYPLAPAQKALGIVPTAEEVEIMAAQSLLHGGRGIIYYTASVCYNADCSEVWSLPNDLPELWRELPYINERIRRLSESLQSHQNPSAGRVTIFADQPLPDDSWLVDGMLQTGASAQFEEEFLTLGKGLGGESVILLRPQLDSLRTELAGNSVTQASLRFWLAERSGDAFATIHAHEILSPWDESSVGETTWPTFASDPFAVAEIPGAASVPSVHAEHWYVEWDVTTLLREWIAGDKPAQGIYLRLDKVDGDAIVLRFPSTEHRLVSAFRDRRILPQLVVQVGSGTEAVLPFVEDARGDIEFHAVSAGTSGLTRFVAINTDADEVLKSVRFRVPAFAGTQLNVSGQGRTIQVDPSGYFTDTLSPYEIRLYSGGLSPAEVARRRADVTGDGVVDILDLVAIGSHFGESIPFDSPEVTNPDVNRDGTVDILDITQVAREFGTQFVPLAPAADVALQSTAWVFRDDRMELVAQEPLRGLQLTLQPSLLVPHRLIDGSGGLYWLPVVQTVQGSMFTAVALGDAPLPPGATIMSVTAQDAHRILGGVSVGTNGRLGLIPPTSRTSLPVAETWLGANYPNPFNPDTWIPYQLESDAEVTIDILSVAGKLVRRLSVGRQRAGKYLIPERAAHWDGRNAQGERVASGVYFYRLRAGKLTAVRKLSVRK